MNRAFSPLTSPCLVLGCVTALLLPGTAGADIVARFDAGNTTAGSVQSTFVGIGATSDTNITGPATVTDGSITLRLAAGSTLANAITKDGSGNFNSTTILTVRNRTAPSTDAGSFTYSDVYRDFITANYLGIQLSGLTANLQYAITFYAYDNNGNRTQSFTDITPNGMGNSGTVTYTSSFGFTGSTPNDVFATTINATSDANGRLFFSESGIGNTNVAVFNGLVVNGTVAPDVTPPTLAQSAIVDDRAGGPVTVGSLVTYTVTFSEDMDVASVDASDFGNAGTATFTIGTVNETSPGVFSVPVTPTGTGSLRLQVNQHAALSDVAGNHLVTTAAILDNTTITVDLADSTNPTLGSGDFSDNLGGGTVASNTAVTFSLTFSEDMDAATVDAADFGNAGTATFTIGAITEISPGVFTVKVTPTSTGTLRLQVLAGAVLTDASGNQLVTTAAITDDTLITVVAGFEPSSVKSLRVFLLGGQSNGDGRALTSGLPTSPVNLQQPQDDVDFFYKVEGRSPVLTKMRPGLSESGNFGPEITLGRCLADNLADTLTTRVALIKYANGGTNLYSQWAGGGGATTAGDGPEYVTFQNTVTAGLAALSAAYPNAVIKIEGMLWVQGESDTVNAAAYQANLTNFIADIRATYGADLLFIVSRLSIKQTAVGSALGTLRAAQDAVAAADPLTGLVNTDTFGINTDNLHFDALGQQQIGDAACKTLLDFYPFLSPPIIARQADGQFRITVNDAFSGFLYTLKTSSTMQPEDWVFAESITSAGRVLVFTIIPVPGEESRFFRVERTKAP